MNIKSRISICFLLMSFLMPGIGNTSESETEVFTHVVIAWLKPEFRNDEYMNELLTANKRLADIPQVLSLQTGTAIASERNMVDDSFDLGNVMTFRSEQDIKDYLAHPIHVEFIDKYIKGKTEKAVVYDF